MKKRPIGRPRNRQEDIKMHFKETDGRCRLDLSGLEYGPGARSSK